MWCIRCVQQCARKSVIAQNSRNFSTAQTLEKKSHKHNQHTQKRIDMMHAKRLMLARKKKPVVELPEPVQVGEIAEIANIPSDRVLDAVAEVAPALRCSRNTVLKDFQLVSTVMMKLGLRCRRVHDPSQKLKPTEDLDAYRSKPTTDSSLLASRPPIVTIMGHIDHGKTTLLDSLRQTKVAEGEAGGITQAVGAFSVDMGNGKTITFLDTPGHAAFSSMRKRGAQLTDVVVLVVAADDSVMEQTIESIKATQLAGVPMIVAINKCDLKKANVDKVKTDLSKHGVAVEELGGTVQCVQISALEGKGLDRLVESIMLQAEMLEVAANNKANVEGIIIESRVDKGIGPVASMIVQQGTLSNSKYLVAGTSMAKVRGLFDENRKRVLTALPGHPVSIFGWKSVPHAGELVLQVESEARAKQVVEYRTNLKNKEKELLDSEAISKEREILKQGYQHIRRTVSHKIERLHKIQKSVKDHYVKDSNIPALDIILKADVDGSLEALLDVVDTYDCSDQCTLNLIDFGVGEVKEIDIEKAHIFQGSIYCFNVGLSDSMKELAAKKQVPIISYDVIYHLIQNLKDKISSLLPPNQVLNVIGEGTVQQLFEFHKGKQILTVAGCLVQSGELRKDLPCALKRNGETVYEGSVHSLRVNKQDVPKVAVKNECGLILEGQVSPQIGDLIQSGEHALKPTQLNWNPRGF